MQKLYHCSFRVLSVFISTCLHSISFSVSFCSAQSAFIETSRTLTLPIKKHNERSKLYYGRGNLRSEGRTYKTSFIKKNPVRSLTGNNGNSTSVEVIVPISQFTLLFKHVENTLRGRSTKVFLNLLDQYLGNSILQSKILLDYSLIEEVKFSSSTSLYQNLEEDPAVNGKFILALSLEGTVLFTLSAGNVVPQSTEIDNILKDFWNNTIAINRMKSNLMFILPDDFWDCSQIRPRKSAYSTTQYDRRIENPNTPQSFAQSGLNVHSIYGISFVVIAILATLFQFALKRRHGKYETTQAVITSISDGSQTDIETRSNKGIILNKLSSVMGTRKKTQKYENRNEKVEEYPSNSKQNASKAKNEEHNVSEEKDDTHEIQDKTIFMNEFKAEYFCESKNSNNLDNLKKVKFAKDKSIGLSKTFQEYSEQKVSDHNLADDLTSYEESKVSGGNSLHNDNPGFTLFGKKVFSMFEGINEFNLSKLKEQAEHSKQPGSDNNACRLKKNSENQIAQNLNSGLQDKYPVLDSHDSRHQHKSSRDSYKVKSPTSQLKKSNKGFRVNKPNLFMEEMFESSQIMSDEFQISEVPYATDSEAPWSESKRGIFFSKKVINTVSEIIVDDDDSIKSEISNITNPTYTTGATGMTGATSKGSTTRSDAMSADFSVLTLSDGTKILLPKSNTTDTQSIDSEESCVYSVLTLSDGTQMYLPPTFRTQLKVPENEEKLNQAENISGAPSSKEKTVKSKLDSISLYPTNWQKIVDSVQDKNYQIKNISQQDFSFILDAMDTKSSNISISSDISRNSKSEMSDSSHISRKSCENKSIKSKKSNGILRQSSYPKKIPNSSAYSIKEEQNCSLSVKHQMNHQSLSCGSKEETGFLVSGKISLNEQQEEIQGSMCEESNIGSTILYATSSETNID